MSKGKKTPRTGVPPKGYVRIVMDYPISAETVVRWDIDQGHRIVREDMGEIAQSGKLVRMLKRTEDEGMF